MTSVAAKTRQPVRQVRGRERQEILDEAALQAVATHGLSALTVQHVADAADVGKSVVLYYCRDRAGLLERVAERAITPWHAAWQVLAEAGGDPRDLLNRWLHAWFALVDAQRPAWRVQVALLAEPADCPGRARVERSDADGLRLLAQVLQRGHGQYVWHAPDPRRTALVLRALVDGMCLEALRSPATDAASRLHGPCRGAVLDLLVRR